MKAADQRPASNRSPGEGAPGLREVLDAKLASRVIVQLLPLKK